MRHLFGPSFRVPLCAPGVTRKCRLMWGKRLLHMEATTTHMVPKGPFTGGIVAIASSHASFVSSATHCLNSSPCCCGFSKDRLPAFIRENPCRAPPRSGGRVATACCLLRAPRVFVVNACFVAALSRAMKIRVDPWLLPPAFAACIFLSPIFLS
jgi:hypothetical protein